MLFLHSVFALGFQWNCWVDSHLLLYCLHTFKVLFKPFEITKICHFLASYTSRWSPCKLTKLNHTEDPTLSMLSEHFHFYMSILAGILGLWSSCDQTLMFFLTHVSKQLLVLQVVLPNAVLVQVVMDVHLQIVSERNSAPEQKIK